MIIHKLNSVSYYNFTEISRHTKLDRYLQCSWCGQAAKVAGAEAQDALYPWVSMTMDYWMRRAILRNLLTSNSNFTYLFILTSLLDPTAGQKLPPFPYSIHTGLGLLLASSQTMCQVDPTIKTIPTMLLYALWDQLSPHFVHVAGPVPDSQLCTLAAFWITSAL